MMQKIRMKNKNKESGKKLRRTNKRKSRNLVDFAFIFQQKLFKYKKNKSVENYISFSRHAFLLVHLICDAFLFLTKEFKFQSAKYNAN